MASTQVLVLGSYVQDHCWTTVQLPGPGESRIGEFSTGPGGKGFNQAVAASRLGAATCFVGAVGRDALASTARAFADAEGLECLWFDTDLATAASSIVVDERGRNQICVALGANLALPQEAVAALSMRLSTAKVLVCQLETALQPVLGAMLAARAAGVGTLLNPAPINSAVSAELVASADLLTPNETEFAFLVEHLLGLTAPADPAQAPAAELHALCRRLSSGTVVITLGEFGAFVSHRDENRRGDAQGFYRVAPAVVNAIDTTGAGDAFSGALAAALALYPQRAFAELVGYACHAAGLSTERPGTAPSMARPAEIAERFGATWTIT